MNLLPGCRFAVAPKFHLSPDWASRITIGTGVEESDGKFFPRGPWRDPTRDELALLDGQRDAVKGLHGDRFEEVELRQVVDANDVVHGRFISRRRAFVDRRLRLSAVTA